MRDFRPNQPLPGHQARRRSPYSHRSWILFGLVVTITALSLAFCV